MSRSSARSSVATFEVGGTFSKAALFSDGEIVDEVKLRTAATSEEIWRSLLEAHRRFERVATGDGREIVRAGLSLPTAVDPVSGAPAACGNIPDLHEFAWKEAIEEATRAPCLVVNDANAALVGEAARGAARGVANVCLLVLGTGVGASFMVDGRLVHGRRGAAGEVGHMPLLGAPSVDPDFSTVVLHEVLGSASLLDEAERQRTDPGTASPRRRLEDLLDGKGATGHDGPRLMARVAARIVGALTVLDTVLASDLYVLAGGIGTSDAVVDTVRQELAMRPAGGIHVVPSLLGDRAGLVGLNAWMASPVGPDSVATDSPPPLSPLLASGRAAGRDKGALVPQQSGDQSA